MESGASLPVDYRNYVERYGANYIYPNAFVQKIPQEIYGESDGYPRGYLIIGDSVSPVHLLLGIREDNWGKIFLWYHSTVDWGDDVNNERDLVFASGSLNELIRSFYDDGSAVARRLWTRGAEKAHVRQIEL